MAAIRSPKHGLTRHSRGWVKSINGETKWICSIKVAPTGELADKVYERRFPELWEDPKPASIVDELDIVSLGNHFMDRKQRQHDAGRLDARTLHEYEAAIQDFVDAVGPKRVDMLDPRDFARARAAFAARFGPARLKKWIYNVRAMFNWAAEPPLRLQTPLYGDEFDVPSKREFRLQRKKRRETKGSLLLQRDEVHRLLDLARPKMRAMILLGLNAGFGNSDLSSLPWSVIDLKSGWIEYARGKSGIERRAPLWPETIKAMKQLPRRDENRVFVTRFGHPYITDRVNSRGKMSHKDAIALRFAALCRKAHITPRGFYSLRHTFRTIADGARDQRAVALIQGRELADIDQVYVEHVGDDRLRAVTDHVRSALVGGYVEGLAATAMRRRISAEKRAPKRPAPRAKTRQQRPDGNGTAGRRERREAAPA